MSTLNKLENAKVEIKVSLDGEKWQEAQKKAFDKLAKKVEVNGFRKGQVPASIVKKHLSEQAILLEAIDALAQQALIDALDEHKIELIDRPELKVENIDANAANIVFVCPVKPEVTLGQYKELGYKVTKPRIQAKEVEEELTRLQERKADLELKEDGAIEDGDTAIIDFEGFKDGVAFEGGKGENHSLVIGSHSFIPGFEEQLIGMKSEEEKEIEVTFPEDYHAEDLKGAKATFKVKVHEIKTKVLPEINEEFIADLKIENVKTLDELKAHIKENLSKARLQENENKAMDELLTKLSNNCTVEIPEVMIETETTNMLKEYESRLMQQGLNINQFYQYTGQTEQDLRNNMKVDATNRVKMSLILEEIAKVENVEVSDNEVDSEFENIAKQYSMSVEDIKKYIDTNSVKYDLKMRKALEIVKA